MPLARSTTQKKRSHSSKLSSDRQYLPRSEGGNGHWSPKEHHKKAVKWLVSHPEALLFLEPGLGKTTIALAAFEAMRKAKAAKKALVIAPKRVCQLVWTHNEGGELWNWRGSFGHLTATLLHGADKDDRIDEDSDIYVINPDGLKWLVENGRLASLVERGVDVLIIDELSKFKHASSKRFKLLKPHLGKFRRRWGMTGSPAANGLLDLFGQAYCIDLGRALGRFITHYRHRYFVPTGFGGYTWKPQAGAEAQIYKALAPIALSMKAEDHLDLPDLIEQNVWVDLPDKARKIYDSMEEDLIALLEDDGAVTAASVAVASGKCRQIASGGLYVEEYDDNGNGVARRPVHIHDEKTDALVDLIDELQGQPVLVIYEFHHDLGRICKALGKDVPAINGQTPDKLTAQYAQQWNRGELPILCGHPAAMGHGLNLQRSGSHVVFYSLTWDYELYDQTVRRLYRHGQKNHVFVHRILARKTVDEDIAKAVKSKKRGQDALLTALKERLHKQRSNR